MVNYKFIFFFIFVLLSNNLFSQLSDLKRFWVNQSKGCAPFEVIIMKEDVDPEVTVIQYDFDYSKTIGIFNPSSNKFHTYNVPGIYTIAQAINQDGVEKIDLMDIEVVESKIPEITIFNCISNELQIDVQDTYYDAYNLYFNDKYVIELKSGNNIINYSSYLLPENKLKGYIKGAVVGHEIKSDINCQKFMIDVVAIDKQEDAVIDSIQLSDDIFQFNLFYNPQKSSNYSLIIDGDIDSSYLTPSYLYFSDYNIKVNNYNFNSKCVELVKNDYCNSSSTNDNLCLIYLNGSINSEGHLLEWITEGDFDSIEVMKNENKIKSINNNANKFVDNQVIISKENYCYTLRGYLNKKVSISNKLCLTAEKNFNPLPIPNAFTPNSDGLNDYFLPVQNQVTDYKMYIFNVLGELIFVSDDIGIGWDGTYKGKIIEDSYFYKIEFILDNRTIVQTGKFVLIK